MPALSGVGELWLRFYEQMMPTEWQDGEIDDTTWHELLRAFIGVKKLHLCAALSQELSRVLQADDIGPDLGLLPDLQEIVSEDELSDVDDLFSSFTHTRRIAGRPVGLASAYWYKAKALDAYTASPGHPDEISFSKGEILYVTNVSGRWWQAQKEDNILGLAPSNYLQIIRPPAGSNNGLHQAKALCAYTASLDDPDKFSFSQDEILDIIDMSGKQWRALKEDGTLGST
ncbi:hypothetical protein EDB83DRAFT_2384745 [Lactarius deliciosus]|nr:hypothetical protein EDB83DRAFT_2384745 [Lactarius deliciosus]